MLLNVLLDPCFVPASTSEASFGRSIQSVQKDVSTAQYELVWLHAKIGARTTTDFDRFQFRQVYSVSGRNRNHSRIRYENRSGTLLLLIRPF